MEDSYTVPEVDFCPLCTPRPHVSLDEVNALSLNCFLMMQWWNAFWIVHLLTQSRKNEKKKWYELFMRKKLTKAEIKAFLGALILLGIHKVRNHRKAWSIRHSILADFKISWHVNGLDVFYMWLCQKKRVLMETAWESFDHIWITSKPIVCHIISHSSIWALMNVWWRARLAHIWCNVCETRPWNRASNCGWQQILLAIPSISMSTLERKYRSWPNLQSCGGSRAILVSGIWSIYWQLLELLDVGIRATGTPRTNHTGVPSSIVALK